MSKLVPDVDPKLIRTWERLLKLTRGSADVVEVLLPVAAGLTRAELSRLLNRAANWREGSPLDAIEQVWKMLGVVPRYRHEELLHRYEMLRGRVEEAEADLRHLRRTVDAQGREAESRQSLDSWSGLIKRTLAAQAELMRSVVADVDDQPVPALPEPEPEPGPAPVAAKRPARKRTTKPADRS